MKFTLDRATLADALNRAGRVVKTNGAIATTGVRLQVDAGALSLRTTNLDVTIDGTVKVTDSTDGTALAPARLLADIVRSLPEGDVVVAVDDTEMVVTGGRGKFNLRLLPLADFPNLPTAPEGNVELDAGALTRGIDTVLGAASKDESRPVLTGVLFEAVDGGVRLVATDSYRMAVRDLPGQQLADDTGKVLVPATSLAELKRLLGSTEKVKVTFGQRNATFAVGEWSVTTRLIDGDYPNYGAIIPSSGAATLEVDVAELTDALKRVKLVTGDASPVKLEMSAEAPLRIVASAAEVGRGHDEVDVTYTGDDLVVAFNPDYLIAALAAAPTERVTLTATDSLKPVRVGADGVDDFIYIVMPVRV